MIGYHVDLETYSEAGYTWRPGAGRWGVGKWAGKGLRVVGLHAYAEHPSTRVLCLAYARTGGPVRGWVPGDPPPADLLAHVEAGGRVYAWNAAFEIAVWNSTLPHWPTLRVEQVECSQARAASYGLPLALAQASQFFEGFEKKSAEGKTLISRYCKPRSPSKNNPDTRNIPQGKGLTDLVSYCEQDVRAETDIHGRCPPMSPLERRVWQVDQAVNNRGIAIDLRTIEELQSISSDLRDRSKEDVTAATAGAVTSPTQVAALLRWLVSRGVAAQTLDADSVASLLATDLPEDVTTALRARQSVAHSSPRKLEAMRLRACADGRLRGLLQYCGAERTGRWAGRGPQPQNLPRGDGRSDPHAKSIKTMDDVAACLRSVFVAGPGHEFVCADYSAIEAVVLACLSGERWRVDLFRRRGDIYSQAAAQITGVARTPGERHRYRQVGKIAELASGYGGSVGAWRAFGAEGSDEDIRRQVYAWRDASPAIVAYWRDQESAAKQAVRSPGVVFRAGSTSWACRDGVLQCVLPSGRSLHYHRVLLTPRPTPWGEVTEQICYYGQHTHTRKWGEVRTYGGKLVENIVQATARDLLAHALVRADSEGWRIVLHVHDEILCEEKTGTRTVEELCDVMTTLPAWAKNWPVYADGWRGQRYRK